MTTPLDEAASSFAELGLRPELVDAVTKLGFEQPSPIQAGVIPLLLEGHDVIGQAQTGTGKTAAFALPILHRIAEGRADGYRGGPRPVQSLVVCPTRELANQVCRAFRDFASEGDVRVFSVYGGQAYGPQKAALRKGVDVVVGTPGRLLDLIQRGDLDLSQAHTIALDEADEMLSMGFVEDIEIILKSFPNEHQTLLFSATMPDPIRRLADTYMTNAESVTVARQAVTSDNVEQRHYLVMHRDRTAATIRLLEAEEITQVIVFGQTRATTNDLAAALASHGYAAEALNGDLAQEARERVMSRFRREQTKILVATDVAARGLDVDGVSHVINYELPLEIESYVHRIGRTGRAGQKGVALTLITPKDFSRLRRLEKTVGQKIPRVPIPTNEQIQSLRDERLSEQMAVKLRRARFKAEKAMVDELMAEGHDPLDIAAAALRLSRSVNDERPIPAVEEVEDRPPRHGSRERDGRGHSGGKSRGYQGKNRGGYRGGNSGKGSGGKGGHRKGGRKFDKGPANKGRRNSNLYD